MRYACDPYTQEESSFVSRLDNLPRLYGIVEQLYEDLNAYYEAFIALPEGPDDEPDMTQRSPKPTSRNLTLVSSEELDALIAQASGPLSRVREEKLGVRRRGLDRASSLRSLHSLASSTQSLPTDSKAQSADITNVRRSSTIASERLVEEASRRPRASSPPPPPPMPHGLGQTVRDAINLKLIPTFPNPPVVKDWDVPVLLVDLGKHANDGWDLTLTKLIPFLDGVNHVKRISQISDTDILLVRQCIEHLLYYSFAIVIDIFQFSNIYAVCPQIARMLDEPGIGEECANYIAKPGQQPLATPMLWRLYSMLRQGRTLHDWCVMAGHYASVVDIRRFITFGVIKGFVRRVYRYPVFLNHGGLSGSLGHYADVQERHGASDASILPAASPGALGRSSVFSSMMFGLSHINASTADNPHEADAGMGMPGAARTKEPRSVWRRNTRPFLRRPTATAIDVASVAHGTDQYRDEPDREGTRPARSPAPRSSPAPPELAGMLDGTRTDDELCVHFNVSWPRLYQMMLQLTQPHLLRMNTDEMSPDRRRMSDHAGTSNPGFVSSLSGASLFVYGDFESRENLRQHDSPERSPARAGLIAVVSV